MTQGNVFGSIVSNWIAGIEFDAIRKANELAKREDLLGKKRVKAASSRKTEKKAARLVQMMSEGEDDEF